MPGDPARPTAELDSHPAADESERLEQLVKRAADQLRDADDDELRAILADRRHEALRTKLAELERDVERRAALEATFHRARSQAHGLIEHAQECHAPRLALTRGRRAERRSLLARRAELLTRAHEHEAKAVALRDAFEDLPTPGHLSRWCTANGPRLARGLLAQWRGGARRRERRAAGRRNASEAPVCTAPTEDFLRAKVKAIWHLLGAPSLASITARHLNGTTIDLGAVHADAKQRAQRTLAELALQLWREDGHVTVAELVALRGEDLDRALRAMAISRRREHTAGRGDSEWIDAELAIKRHPRVLTPGRAAQGGSLFAAPGS